jgi:hypothetical protein
MRLGNAGAVVLHFRLSDRNFYALALAALGIESRVSALQGSQSFDAQEVEQKVHAGQP